ncbi:glycosyltransferase family 2 protein [Bradyrhizobium sp. SEMIA]|uniref:glycosyltransferase family 2 protein n=1 Tax=Bradyrhizobium sp. SEMIA TaxID=2597515 RepID=UPI0018A54FB1|nr:glycosyltransferase family 2 protein [Bradyrhizobium sp. SEMIA]QOG22156.1 glycosyltransferase [Bradyrhizobium sp. SEMIA]
MSVLIVCASFAIAVAVAVPILVFAVQIFVAARTGHVPPQDVRRPGFAVIVPAHDEEQGIAPTLQSIRRELTGSDRLVVVADNCSDRTADVAAAAGAEVTSRNDPMHRGKGFALDHGLQFLTRTGAPEVVIIVDADCQVAEGALARIAALAASTGRPVQAAYLMAPTRSGDLSPIRNLAWFTKNYVRPLGWLQLGLPTQLTGSGMSFPTHLLGSVSLATDELVEDLSLGLKLALRGRAPLFCPEAVVTSQFPEDVRAEKSQRTRWEHGYLHSIITHAPRLFGEAIKRRDLNLLGLVLDLIVPPLSLLIVLTLASLFQGALVFFWTDTAAPFAISLGSTAVFVLAVMVLWSRFGRDFCSLADLLKVPIYVLAKIPLYLKFILNRQRVWVRTDRDSR